jgi:hypothetical protein
MNSEIIATNSEVQSLDNILLPVKETIETLQKGENILVEAGNQISLLKYESAQVGSQDPLRVRMNRHTSITCLGNLFRNDPNDPYTHKDPSKRITAKARAEILGTHRIDFTLDDEFGIYLPSADSHTDLYLTLANKFGDGRVEKLFDNITVVADESLLVRRLQEITRPQYFEQNVVPFLESRTTDLEMPKWILNGNFLTGLVKMIKGSPDSRKPNYGRFNMSVAHDWLSNVAKYLEHGDFVYVGSKEEVYLLGVAKDDDGSLYMQGTYTTSSKPMLWFSNNYLGHMSKSDMQRPMFKGDGPCNVARYRTSNPPSFDEQPFIFTAMGRSQDCKNSIFTGEPDLITGDLSEALTHFRTTDFKEFEDVVKNYANKVNEPTPNAKPNGRFFIKIAPCFFF